MLLERISLRVFLFLFFLNTWGSAPVTEPREVARTTRKSCYLRGWVQDPNPFGLTCYLYLDKVRIYILHVGCED
jgi:hypothetical protein